MRLLAVAIVCVTWCAGGFVMAFRPNLYRRWVENSWTGRHMPRMTERYLQKQWSFRFFGILAMAFGVCSFIAFALLLR
jgi:ammonia channel protein AmtB